MRLDPARHQAVFEATYDDKTGAAQSEVMVYLPSYNHLSLGIMTGDGLHFLTASRERWPEIIAAIQDSILRPDTKE